MSPRDLLHDYLAEDDVLLAARRRAGELGCRPVDPSTGAMLRFLAASVAARAVVEVGTGTGVSGVWLLRGMAPDGVLTSIDSEPERQRAARTAFADAGLSGPQLRLINGMAHEVLPRLADAAYDLVFIDASGVEYPRYLDEAVRLLRPGGVVALNGILLGGQLADPGAHDVDASALREVTRQTREDDSLISVLLPLEGGLLVALRAA
jgi:predicted O-methyltransferase YrrM